MGKCQDTTRPVLRTGECTKSTNQLEREITSEDWWHCFYCRSFKTVNWAIFVQSENHKPEMITPPRLMNYAKIPYKSTTHQHRGSSTRSLLYHRSWTLNRKQTTCRRCSRCAHSYRRKTNTLFTMLHMFRQQCQRSRSYYRYNSLTN